MIVDEPFLMPRTNRKINPEASYHITARSNNKQWFGMDPSELWKVFGDYLHFLHFGFKARIHCFVLMSNHFHLLASFPDNNLSMAMCYFMTNTSRSINSMRGSINHVYGGRFHSSLIQSSYHYANVYKYIVRNPIKERLSQSVEEFPYGTLKGLYGKERIIIPITNHLFGLDEMIYSGGTIDLSWLNTMTSIENDQTIAKALKKRIFLLPKEPGSRKPNQLDSALI